MANWHIGQEIVCVKTHSLGYVKRGKTYTIRGLKKTHCPCKFVIIDIGMAAKVGLGKCNVCGLLDSEKVSEYWFNESLFAPLDQDISELTEILEQANVVKL